MSDSTEKVKTVLVEMPHDMLVSQLFEMAQSEGYIIKHRKDGGFVMVKEDGK